MLKKEPNRTHSPLEMLQHVASLPGDDFCRTGNCTWLFEPGTYGSYSSTNFVLAGLIMLAYAPESRNTWDTYSQAEALGLDLVNDYEHTFFPNKGELNKVGLTVPGESLNYGT